MKSCTKRGQSEWSTPYNSRCVRTSSKVQGTKYGKTSCRLRLIFDGTRTETRFHLSTKQTSPFKLAGASVQSTAGSQGVRISGSNAGYTTFRGSVKGTGYPLHLPVPLFPFTSPPVHHRVPSHFNWTLLH